MTHLLVTNDFPPKVGGIQSYLWELWRRLPPESFAVLTTAHQAAAAFDAAQPFRVERMARQILLPTAGVRRRIQALAGEIGAAFVVLDPVLPLGAVGPRLGLPYLVVGHGAEIAIPGRLAGPRGPLAHVLRSASGAVSGGAYVAGELRRAAGRDIVMCDVPPGVDPDRFVPLAPEARLDARRSFGLPQRGPLVVSVGRLVPRKGADVLIDAVAQLVREHPGLTLAIAGTGRDRERLGHLAVRRSAPVRFLDKVPFERLPALYACADVFAAPTRSRWAGLEQEGFGIVFVEAAACGVPQVGGRSGGVPEAVAEGETGLLVDDPCDPAAVAQALRTLLGDARLRQRLGEQGRDRVVARFSYPVLAARLAGYLDGFGTGTAGLPPVSPGIPRPSPDPEP